MQHNSIDMDYIFQTCPRLQSLQLDSPSTLYLQGSWTGSSSNNNTGSSIPPLRSLHLENACFSQSSLESLLQATPHMRRLQLRNLRRQDPGECYSWNSLYKCLVSLALPLKSIHFSVLGQQPADDAQEAQEKVLMICPHATEWSFRTSDLTPILRQILQELPNFVTTLNLVTESVNQPNKALTLHQYLCESPHLLHLNASQSFCLIERMDLFGRWMPLPRHGEDAYRQPGIWMCRQLQTLRIEVHNLGPADRQLSPTRSRVLFGYISREEAGIPVELDDSLTAPNPKAGPAPIKTAEIIPFPDRAAASRMKRKTGTLQNSAASRADASKASGQKGAAHWAVAGSGLLVLVLLGALVVLFGV